MPEAKADFTTHPRYAIIQTIIDSLIEKVRTAQANYFLVNNRYFQGLITPENPLDGLENISVSWLRKPIDQEASWYVFDPTTFKAKFDIPFQIRIDTYQSPRGHGWILVIDVWRSGLGVDDFGNSGDHWSYRHHEGPDSSVWGILDKWFVVVEE